MPNVPYRLTTAGDPEGDGPGLRPFRPSPVEPEDLAYVVELWNEAKASVEQVLAVTASGSIGYAAYYAATREYPHRYITLRHRNSIINRWNGPAH
jgi:hypothetical protein